MEDMYGLYSSSSASGPHSQFQVQDYFPVDDLLDFSNDDLFSSSTSSTDSFPNHHAPPPPPPQPHNNTTLIHPSATTDFANALCIPDMDPELEWLSRFNDDTITDFPAPDLSATILPNPNGRSFPSRVRVKTEPEGSESVRRCTHCASEKTPQWRTGPMGPKTLCNACGVRYKSGRLVPEYRPAASPTFVLTQHSNSHRKVMELRRQKEMNQQLPEDHHPRYYLHPNVFRVC